MSLAFSESMWSRLRALRPEELLSLDDRIHARSGSPSPDASLILHAVGRFGEKQPAKAELWSGAFGGLPFDPKRLRDAITSLRGFLRGQQGGIGRIKLVKWLRRMPPEDRLRFLGYAMGMHGANNFGHIALLHVLIKGDQVAREMSREELHALWRGSISFREEAITVACHFLLQVLKEFLSIQNLLRSPIETRMRLARELQSQGWYPELEKELQEIDDRMSSELVDEDFELIRRQAVELSIAHSLAMNPAVDISILYERALWHQQESALMNMVQLVTAHFSNKSSKPSGAAAMADSIPKTLNVAQALRWIDAVRDLAQPHGLLLRCSLLSLDMLRDSSNDAHFYLLRRTVKEEGHELAESMRADMYRHLFNWAQQQTRMGRTEFEEVLGQMYEEVAGTGLLLRGRQIQPNRLRILVLVLCRTGRVDLARAEYERLKGHLPMDGPANVHELCLGIIAFFSGDYEAANKLFSQVLILPDPIRFLLDARVYQVEISLLRLKEDLVLVERILDYRPTFEFVERNLRTFVRAKQAELGAEDSIGVANFGRYCRLLYAVQHSPNSAQLRKRLLAIGEKLAQEQNLYHRSFLNDYMQKVMAALP